MSTLDPIISDDRPRFMSPKRLTGLALIAVALVVGAVFFASQKGLSATPTASLAGQVPPQSIPLTALSQGLSAQSLSTQQLTVNGRLIVKSALALQSDASIQGNLTVNGNGTFGGSIQAANFSGSGSSLTGVDAALLGGKPGSYYTSLAGSSTISANAALKNTANTFTAANDFAVGLTSAGITDSGALTVDGPAGLGGTTTIADLILSAPLDTANGGTGLTSVPAQGVLYGQGGPVLGVAARLAPDCAYCRVRPTCSGARVPVRYQE